MRRYTTPTQELTVRGIDLTDMDVYVTYVQGECRKVTMQPEEVAYDADSGNTTVTVSLSQLQTAQFKPGKRAQVEVNFIDADGKRNATAIREINITQNLLDEELTYGE